MDKIEKAKEIARKENIHLLVHKCNLCYGWSWNIIVFPNGRTMRFKHNKGGYTTKTEKEEVEEEQKRFKKEIKKILDNGGIIKIYNKYSYPEGLSIPMYF